ncbi:MAG: deoxyribose-phosphate aldolase [Deltaproteobacteria bacterium]|nr:deoxyribose-phosphate aldolase [Deltaproteobacteria bacterium]
MDRQEIIEAVTRRVLEALEHQHGGCCSDCAGGCAACCSEEVRSVVGAGACRISYCGNGGKVPSDLGQFIDHTLLKPETTPADIDQLCDEALEFGFSAVCVNPVWVKRASQRLRGSSVQVASVVGFPLGASAPEIKAMEARRAIRDGAREIDMVINIGALKGGEYDLVEKDIARVSDACKEVGALNKVIIETALLNDQEKVIACRLALAGRAHYVKTSTGFSSGGATLFDVALMREVVGPEIGVKASGGIKTTEDARRMIDAGATRLGASAGIQIVKGIESSPDKEGEKSGGY